MGKYGIDSILDSPEFSDVSANSRSGSLYAPQEVGSSGAGSATPWGAIASGVGGVISALTSWYAVNQQRQENAKARKQQDQFFYENLGFEKTQANRSYGLAQQNAALEKRKVLSAERLGTRQQAATENTNKANIELGKRGMTVQEQESAANIATKERAQTLSEKTAKFDQAATMITNMTKFFNSPQTRSQYAGLWQGYGR